MQKYVKFLFCLLLFLSCTVIQGAQNLGKPSVINRTSTVKLQTKDTADTGDTAALEAAQKWLQEIGYNYTVDQIKALKKLQLQLYTVKHVQLIIDANLVHLKVMTNLEELALPRQIGDAGLANIAGLTKLNNLNIYDSKITDAGLVYLKDLKNLQTLVISANNLSDAGMVHLKDLTNITLLNLSSTNITDQGLQQLQEMKGMTKLFLFRVKITNNSIPLLKTFSQLQRLNIQATQIDADGLSQLKDAFPNCEINY